MPGYLTTQVTSRAQVPLVHKGDGAALIANNDLVNTIWISDDFGVQPNAGNSAPLPPQASVVVDGSTDVFGVAQAGQTATVVVLPGGLNFFQLVDIIIKALVINTGGTIPTGVFVYNGIGAPGNPPIDVLVAPGTHTDPYGNTITGNTNISAISTAQSSATPITVGNTNTITRVTPQYKIPANSYNVGTVYRFSIGGNGTMGATARGMIWFINLAGQNVIQATFASTAIAVNGGFTYFAHFDVFCTAIGAAGNNGAVCPFNLEDDNSGNNTTPVIVDVSGNPINTTIDNLIEVDFQLQTGLSTGFTVTNEYSILERLGV